MSSPTSAATPALSARQRSPLSSARALKIASAIGLRQTFAVHTKRICLVWFSVALLSVIYPLPLYPSRSSCAPSKHSFSKPVFYSHAYYRGVRAYYSGWLLFRALVVDGSPEGYHRATHPRLR